MILHELLYSTLSDETLDIHIQQSLEDKTELVNFTYDKLMDKPGSVGYTLFHWFSHKRVLESFFDWDNNRMYIKVLNVDKAPPKQLRPAWKGKENKHDEK